MATVTRFEDLEVWQLERTLPREIFETYTVPGTFQKDYGLVDQVNRASGSVMDNIAEGLKEMDEKSLSNFWR